MGLRNSRQNHALRILVLISKDLISFRRVVRTPARLLQARGLVQTAEKQLASTDFVAGGAISAADAMVRTPCADADRSPATAIPPKIAMKEPCALEHAFSRSAGDTNSFLAAARISGAVEGRPTFELIITPPHPLSAYQKYSLSHFQFPSLGPSTQLSKWAIVIGFSQCFLVVSLTPASATASLPTPSVAGSSLSFLRPSNGGRFDGLVFTMVSCILQFATLLNRVEMAQLGPELLAGAPKVQVGQPGVPF